MVTVKIRGQIATVNGEFWTSNDKELADLLNDVIIPPGPSSPDPDWDMAQQAVKKFSAKVLKHIPVKSEPGVIY